jgi:hypothetical protein
MRYHAGQGEKRVRFPVLRSKEERLVASTEQAIICRIVRKEGYRHIGKSSRVPVTIPMDRVMATNIVSIACDK